MCEDVYLLAELGFLARHHGESDSIDGKAWSSHCKDNRVDGKASSIHCTESRVDGKASSMR